MNLNLFNRYLKNSLGISSILVLFCLGGYGCSTGASAPPVSLPAPVTGRLTVSSPDETTGVALVSGDDGTVTTGSLVQATNESKTSALLIPVLDLFPTAEAPTTFPDICRSEERRVGKEC